MSEDGVIRPTVFGLVRAADGRMVEVTFLLDESAELSVLGRDVTNNFGVIYDYPNRAVALLALPHYYDIKRQS